MTFCGQWIRQNTPGVFRVSVTFFLGTFLALNTSNYIPMKKWPRPQQQSSISCELKTRYSRWGDSQKLAHNNQQTCPILQEMEYHNNALNGSQSNASISTDELRQQTVHIPDASLVEDDDQNWSSEDIAPENDNKILQHGNGRNDVSAQRYAVSSTSIINFVFCKILNWIVWTALGHISHLKFL